MQRRSSFTVTGQSLFWPTLAMLIVLGCLLGLGTWQLSRKAWKEELIETIHHRAGAEPIVLDAAVLLFKTDDLEYTPVRARGRFIPAKTMLYFAPDQRLGPGYHLYMPLETQGGDLVIINRGFVPERELGAVQSRMQGPPESPTEVIGLLRKSGTKGLFAAANDRLQNRWFWRDLAGMTEHVQDGSRKSVAPFFLDALQEKGPIVAGVGRGGATRLDLPNRHYEYAMTWYGLAAALIGVYLAFVRGRRNRRFQLTYGGTKRRRGWSGS